MKRILIPVDGSQPAIHAVQAMLTARTYDPVERVDLLSVQIPLKSGKIGRGLSQAEIDAYYQDEGRAALEEASRLLSQAGVPFEARVEVGAAADTIARIADETGADEIYMGSRGLGSVSSLFMGSVATRVLHLTELPVTLVK
ncbi:universal stress protein [Achromobacter marplatensis]|uniref:Universal stress protein n=1 Tax=Achromobacter marplatensis TaxID=470868 RepID=A0AA42WBM0_9BURK|nr:universal stress protein [Achromobacter marplatensis]EJO32953.1 universal stress family protein 7 [Achromobacter marplatensis]MDH2050664.1 universal stress protein [Achromobacter marplatensis]